jgi:hypothetical protein
MILWVVDYYEAGNDRPFDCHPDFFRDEASANEQAAIFMRELPWADRWTLRSVDTGDDC